MINDEKIRLKDLDAQSKEKYETLSPDMRAFVDEYKQLRGSVFKITSGKRTAKEGSDFSHHHKGDALDVSAMNYEDYNFLMNTKDGLALLNKYQLGVLDETDPAILAKTGGTGAHFHIGKDSGLYAKTKQRFEAFDSGVEPTISYKQRYELGEDPKAIIQEKYSEAPNSKEVSYGADVKPFEVKQYEDVFGRVTEKEIVKEVKTEQSSDRQEIKNEMSREEEFIKEYLKQGAPRQAINYAQNNSEETVEPIRINVDVQTELPTLQNIFELPQFEEGGIIGDPPTGYPPIVDPIIDENGHIKLTTEFPMERFGRIDPNRSKRPAPITYSADQFLTNPKEYESYYQQRVKDWNATYDYKTKGFYTADSYRLPTENEKLVRLAQLESIPRNQIQQSHIEEYEALKNNKVWVSPTLGFQKTMVAPIDLRTVSKPKKDSEKPQIKPQTTPQAAVPQQQNVVQTPPAQKEERFAYKNQTVFDATTKKWVLQKVPYAQYVEGKGWVDLETPGLVKVNQ